LGPEIRKGIPSKIYGPTRGSISKNILRTFNPIKDPGRDILPPNITNRR